MSKYFYPTAFFFAPVRSQELWLLYVLFRFHFLFTVMLLEYMRITISLFLCIVFLGPSAPCPVLRGFSRRSLKTNGLP